MSWGKRAGSLVQQFPNWGALALGGAERYNITGLLAKGADFTTDLQKQSRCGSLFTFAALFQQYFKYREPL